MAKNKFGTPSIILTLNGDEGSGDIIGNGTGTGIPSGDNNDTDYVSYEDWLILFEDQEDVLDYNHDGQIGTEDDWVAWMIDNGFEDLLP